MAMAMAIHRAGGNPVTRDKSNSGVTHWGSRIVVHLVLSLCVYSSGILAGNWTITPVVTVGQIYSDNIELAESGREKNDYVTEITPAISINRQGARASLDFNYRMQNLLHTSSRNRGGTNHELLAQGDVELVKDNLFVDARTSHTQQNITNTGRQGDNINDTGNRSDVFTFSISPYWQQHFGRYADGVLRYTFNRVDVDNADRADDEAGDTGVANDTTSNRIDANLISGQGFTAVGWQLNYQREDIDRDFEDDARFERYDGQIRYFWKRELNAFTNLGYEDNDIDTTRDQDNGFFWNVGLTWVPSRRFTLEGALGNNRFVRTVVSPTTRTSLEARYENNEVGLNSGEIWSVEFRHRTRRTTWQVSYEEETTTSRRDLQERLFPEDDPFGNPIETPQDNPSLTDEVFVRKRLRTAVTRDTVKSQVSLNLFYEQRDFLEQQTGQGDGNDDEKVFGGTGSLTWRFADRTGLLLRGLWEKTDFEDERDDKRLDLFVGIAHALPPPRIAESMFATVDYRYIDNDSNDPFDEYTENRISARLTVTF